ncbi:MAG: RecQ family ATP-dependent DNA helicase [Thermoanaerobaculia bacterium]
MSNSAFEVRRALELLRLGTRLPHAEFRPDQEEAIRHLVLGRGRLLVVQRTGWGKSFVYFIAGKLLREAGRGPTLLISPLLSLMRNQIEAAGRMGVKALTIHSQNRQGWSEVEEAVQRDEVDVLLISPERLANEQFQRKVLTLIAQRLGLLVVDEAHCISDWGHDFRPHYRLLGAMIRALPPNLPLLATTATANNRVCEDLNSVLGPNLKVLRGELARPSLLLQTIRLPRHAQRLAWLAHHVPTLPGSGIIYTLTVRDAQQVARWLKSRDLRVEAYYGDQGEERPDLEQALLDNRVKALVATTALGMGFDKPDLAFVIHYQTPGSVVAYYQQVGRAGRALSEARGVLLSGEEEGSILDYFIESAFPTREEVHQVLDCLEAALEGLSLEQLQEQLNLSKPRIEKTLALLALESPAPIVKEGSRWQLTAAHLEDGFWQRAERLTRLRHDEKRQMQEYVDLERGHMEFLIKALDGEPGALAAPSLPALPAEFDPRLLTAATAFLRQDPLEIEPRKQWPGGNGLERHRLQGRIALTARPGRALCSYRDETWGPLVEQGKYRDGQFSQALVEACVELVRRWRPQPAPTWVTCVPSLRHPRLVPDFAERLAKVLGLPFELTLIKVEPGEEQKRMANSAQQARNVDRSLDLRVGDLPSGPVLLIDDMVDSRWTLTLAAWLLRSGGSGDVWPLVLAVTGKSR